MTTTPQAEKRFDLSEWRKKSLLSRLITLALCTHSKSVDVLVSEHHYQGDTEPAYPGMMKTLFVSECCKCGHFSVRYAQWLRDRSPGAFDRWLENKHD